MDEGALPLALFGPRPLDNLILSDELDSLDPIIDAKVANILGQDTPQIFAACGRGARSTFRMLRYGLEVAETVSSDLPGVPNAVWTVKLNADGESSKSGQTNEPQLIASCSSLPLFRRVRLLHHSLLR